MVQRTNQQEKNTLKGKTALITGGSRGFGRGIVEVLSKEQMRVIAIARNQTTLERLQSEVKGEIKIYAADATDATIAVDIIQRERPNTLVLNVGSLVPIRELQYLSWEQFSTNWNVDVKSTFLWAREAILTPLPSGSRIIIISSTAARGSFPVISGYVTAKTAQIALARCLASVAHPLGIKVQFVLPTLTTHTELGQRSVSTFAIRAGVGEKEIMEQLQIVPPITPRQLGEGIKDILVKPEFMEGWGFRISNEGVNHLSENEIFLPINL